MSKSSSLHFIELAHVGIDSEDAYTTWNEMQSLLDGLMADGHNRIQEAAKVLRKWPKEVPRTYPRVNRDHQTAVFLERAGILHHVDETQVYPLFLVGLCDLVDVGGFRYVRLSRAFTGKLADRRIGQVGQADLMGGLSIAASWDRIEVTLEVEVKIGDGKQSKEQIDRMNALRSRGGVYVLTRTVRDGRRQIAAEYERLLKVMNA